MSPSTPDTLSHLRRMAWAALAGGLAAGALLFVLQAVWLSPLIAEAERFEQAPRTSTGQGSAPAPPPPARPLPLGRQGATLPALLTAGVGFGLLLCAGFGLSGRRIGVARGVLWGLAGYLSFMVAPSLGLPPEPPGVTGAPLLARQLWWSAAVAGTAGGLWLLLLSRGAIRLLGPLLVLLPHFLGAPEAPAQAAVELPAVLVQRYQLTVLLLTAAHWVILGAVCGGVWGWLHQQGDTQ